VHFPPYYTVLLVTGLILSRRAVSLVVRPWDTQQLLHTPRWSSSATISTSADRARVHRQLVAVRQNTYLFWPATLRIVRSRHARVIFALAVCLLVPVLRFDAIGLMRPERVHSLSHLRIDSILWGALAALVFEWLSKHSRIRRAVVYASAAAALFFVREQMTFWGYFIGFTVLAIAVAAFVSNIAANPQSRLVSLLETAPLRGIGKVSYGMYLLHFQALDVVRALAPPGIPHILAFVLFSIAAVALTWAVAAAMYKFVNGPPPPQAPLPGVK
jgi:peptidoglycan/LPS O-acetylase OafA/YrhL